MSNDIDHLHDEIAIELDRRKLEKLVNDGVVSREELAKAPIIEMSDEGYEMDKPDMQHIVGVTCGMCGFSCKTMVRFEKHLIDAHIEV